MSYSKEKRPVAAKRPATTQSSVPQSLFSPSNSQTQDLISPFDIVDGKATNGVGGRGGTKDGTSTGTRDGSRTRGASLQGSMGSAFA